jgi:NAD(P) transhydrogenase subunit beta
MPELVGIFNGLGGGASGAIAYVEISNSALVLSDFSVAVFSMTVGVFTFSGSLIAVAKLRGKLNSFNATLINLLSGVLLIGVVALLVTKIDFSVEYIIILSLLLGITRVILIGGADMPVVIAFLNSLSGIAAAFTGFIFSNSVLIVAGSLVGASGIILTFIMCKAMNRRLIDVLFKSFGGSGEKVDLTRTKVGSDADEVAMMVDGAQKVIIVPGYGMAVSQCQHQVKEFADLVAEKFDTEVKYAIHPVAGRMPGHMNVLLAEANVPYEQLIEMDEINPEFPDCDIALVIGANDTTNPAARSGEGPLAGMPIIDVDGARTVVIIKRSLSVGYAGVDNDLFYMDKTMMLFGDGKKMMTELNNAVKEI